MNYFALKYFPVPYQDRYNNWKSNYKNKIALNSPYSLEKEKIGKVRQFYYAVNVAPSKQHLR